MRVLVIHPEDELQDEPWVSLQWGRVIDLGKTGAESYAQATARYGAPVTGLDEFRDGFKEMRRVRELLARGLDRLKDSFGLDWWELTSILVHQELETTILLRELAESLGAPDEVYVSRPGFHADVLRLALGSRLRTFSPRGYRRRREGRHYLQVLKKFPIPQLLEIFWDKTDPGYQVRGTFGIKPKLLSSPVVLLPSAYINVSRTAVAYAEILPQARFLLVATRRSGWIQNAPSNVSITWLRRYASVGVASRKLEHQDLVKRCDLLRSELKSVPEFSTLDELGKFDEFSDRFARGLEIRDAWRNVLDCEPVQAVICADDSNPYTRIPLLLAKQKGLATIACHHGALDGRYMFKRNHADVLLAKGKMEEDYLVRMCGIQPETIEVGAPSLPAKVKSGILQNKASSIVFFSEAYEVARGRAPAFYHDILPPLADLARSESRELIIKLHPSESLTERIRLVELILSPEQLRVTRVVEGTLKQELLDESWFCVTVMSTVAVECALQGIPCFLCAWLESWPYGYVDQFARFDVGIRLREPAEISQIPTILRSYQGSSAVRENCWTPVDPQRLLELLSAGRNPRTTAATHS